MAIPLGRPLRVLNNQSESLNVNTRIAGGRITQQIKEPSKVNDIILYFLNNFVIPLYLS